MEQVVFSHPPQVFACFFVSAIRIAPQLLLLLSIGLVDAAHAHHFLLVLVVLQLLCNVDRTLHVADALLDVLVGISDAPLFLSPSDDVRARFYPPQAVVSLLPVHVTSQLAPPFALLSLLIPFHSPTERRVRISPPVPRRLVSVFAVVVV